MFAYELVVLGSSPVAELIKFEDLRKLVEKQVKARCDFG